MPMTKIQIGHVSLSRMILGGNPFSGFSHQSAAKDDQMRHYYTTDRIKQALKLAEQAEINTHIGRADHHIMRVLMEYWDEGGHIQWLAQTCPEIGSPSRGVDNAIRGGASGCFLHGGMMDKLLADGDLAEVPVAIEKIKQAGLISGIAGHNPKVFEWAEANLDVDFYMCSYYNPSKRNDQGEMLPDQPEYFGDDDREMMVDLIQHLSKPVIHYKVFAAGRKDPAEALAFVARHLRSHDAVCIGVYLKEQPESVTENVHLLEQALARTA